jgi:hypothetical protein
MATVTSNLTRINDVEGALTSVSIGGGAGATANTDIFIQGAQSLGRRQSSVTLTGFLLDDGVGGNDLSAADVHVGMWIWHTHYSVLTALRVRFASNSGSGNYDEHIVPLTEYPTLGGWIRVWVDISRTPDATGGTALDEATVRYFGPINSLPTVGGNAQNLILDAIDHTTTGLTLTGTNGVWQDFLTADEGNTTNKYGVVYSSSGVIFCAARLTLGTASSLVFDDSDFVIIFPQQNLVNNTFMGISCNLSNGSTVIEMTNGNISSAGVKQGDFVVTNTSGSLFVNQTNFSNLRIITLTDACFFDGCKFAGCGLITAAGASIINSTITGSTASSALLWNYNGDTSPKLDGSTFISGGTGHAIELGSNTPTTIDFDNITFTGYGADGTTNAALYNNSGKSITININGGTTPTVRNGTGASTTIVAGAVTVTVNVITVSGSAVSSAQVLLKASDNLGPFPFEETVTITNSGTTATVTHTSHGLSTNDKVLIKGASHYQNNGVFTITVTGVNSYTYTMSSAPGSNPTGTIIATYVLLYGTTDVNGQISTSRVFGSNQNVSGWARKSSSPPLYKTAQIAGQVNSSSGANFTALLVVDE